MKISKETKILLMSITLSESLRCSRTEIKCIEKEHHFEAENGAIINKSQLLYIFQLNPNKPSISIICRTYCLMQDEIKAKERIRDMVIEKYNEAKVTIDKMKKGINVINQPTSLWTIR